MNALTTKIEDISIDAKQAEQINLIFDIGFEMGMAFEKDRKITRDSALYQLARRLYLEAASKQCVETFDSIMKNYEKHRPS
jgi:ribulose bisphosphate carboxylase small subunit